MAVDAYLVLTPYAGAGFGPALKTESQAKVGLRPGYRRRHRR